MNMVFVIYVLPLRFPVNEQSRVDCSVLNKRSGIVHERMAI